MTKLQEANARINRAVSKAVTNCGCLKIHAERQRIPMDVSLRDIKNFMNNHIEGELCEQCRETLEAELGNSFFYQTALCNLLGLNLTETVAKERERIQTLGVFKFC